MPVPVRLARRLNSRARQRALNVAMTASRSMPRQPNPVQTAFLRNLQQGRLPVMIAVIKTDENDADDWIEFEFGDPDPAISPLR